MNLEKEELQRVKGKVLHGINGRLEFAEEKISTF